MTVRFNCTTHIAAPRATVFALALDVDAHTGSMARSRERAIAGTVSGELELGDDVTWRAWHFGLPFTMTSRIVELEWPRRFVDQQQRGPFARFHHEHLFDQRGTSTVMIDEVAFDAPFGAFGRLAERLVLARYLRRLIERRNAFLENHLESKDDRAR